MRSFMTKKFLVALFLILLSIIFICCCTKNYEPIIAPNPTLIDKEGVSISIDFDNNTISIKNRRTDHDIRVVVYIKEGTAFWDLAIIPIYEKRVGKGKSSDPERINLRSGECFKVTVYVGHLIRKADIEYYPVEFSYPPWGTKKIP